MPSDLIPFGVILKTYTMSVEALNETLGIEVGPMDRVSVTVAAPDTIRSWSKGR